MGDFLNLDNPFFRGVNKLVDCIYLGLLWFVCSLPVITIGASTTALYYTIQKTVRRGLGYATKEFFHSFKDNFKQATLVWLLWLLMAAFLGMDIYIMWHFASSGQSVGVFFYVFLLLMAVLVAWGLYLFPYIARFENSTKNTMKNAIIIAIVNFDKTILLLLLAAVFAFLAYIVPFTPVFFTGIFVLIQSFLLEKVFRKYMSEEDLAAEDEKNREF